MQGQVIWPRAREKSVDAPLLVQSSSATLPNLSRPQLWSSHLAGAHERHAFGPQLWTSCPAGTRKAEGSAALPSGVQQRCPRAPTPEPGKGRRPKNRHSSKTKRVSARVFCLLPVLACLWRGFPGSGSLVLRPCPFGFLFVLFRLMFLFFGRGRHVPAPSGRDVGSSAGAPTQEPELGTDPRTGFFRYPSTYVFLVYFVAPALFFPFLFATLFSRMYLSFGMLSGYPRLLTIGLKLSSVWIGEVLFALGHHCLDVPRSVRARHLRSLNVMLCSPWFWCSYAVCRVPPFLRPILCVVRGGTRRVIIVIA